MRLPVHCCCTPDIRLGWLELPDSFCKPMALQVVARPTYGPRSLLTPRVDIHTEVKELRLAGSIDETILAVKSAHQPIDVWRRVLGFTEERSE